MGNAVHYPQSGIQYEVFVKTGDRTGMDTNADVYIKLYNAQRESSGEPMKLSNNDIFIKDFKRGRVSKFKITIENDSFGEPTEMELSVRDESGSLDMWYCEAVMLRCRNTNQVYIFPVHRWIFRETLRLKKYDMVLPQDDTQISQRRKELRVKRKIYKAYRHQETQMMMCKTLPSDESFSCNYKWNLTRRALMLMFQTGLVNVMTGKIETLTEIMGLYNGFLPAPAGMRKWKSDKNFGYQRLIGCNPNQIRLCKEIPKNFAVEDASLVPQLEGMSIEEALKNKKLFIVNYEILGNLPCTDGRKICAPLALFFVNREKNLMPVAIQLFQVPAPENPVFYPSDPKYTWLLAKCYFNLADASVHESATHLGFTHLIGESVVIATNRCLSPSHPVHRLLMPHFRYLLAINKQAVTSLVVEGGWVDQTMAIGRIGMFEIIKRKWETWRLGVEGSLLDDLQERGVADPNVLPNYHYRDDAVLLHRAIYKYVKRIIDAHYDDGAKITEDAELQEWGRFIGGMPTDEERVTVGMKGLPNDGNFATAKEVTKTVTNFIFILSAGHAAANFGQYDQYGFPPCYPAWLHGEPPRDKRDLTEWDIVKQLPDKSETLNVMIITRLLSTRGTNALGDFEMQTLFDPASVESLETFRNDLQVIGRKIDARNEKRQVKYTCLHPKEVPNSISI